MTETREELAHRLIHKLVTDTVPGTWFTLELELDGVWTTKQLRRAAKPSENEVRSHFTGAGYTVGQIRFV